ncbi:putative Major facilitator superfamily domain-containing protein [Naja naja]|nr:putative Major facilitator superfamily domain-containing protein [Naja naja]
MDSQRKKKRTGFTIGLLFLSGGIEYAVILPTIWAYLQKLNAEPYYLGLALSAFSFAGLITGPFFGYWSDRTHRTKGSIMFANLFQIAGNFMYFVGGSKWMLLSSRLVAGVGTGAGASIFGYLTRSTTSQERSKVFAAVMACRQLFMCLVWILLQIIVMVMYYDIEPPTHMARSVPTVQRDALEDEQKPLIDHEGGQEAGREGSCYGSTPVGPPQPSLGDECRYVPNGHWADEESAGEDKNPFHRFSSVKEYLREEVVVLLTAQFITLFNQTALETMVTPITQRYLNFGELENSIMYFLCGVEVIAGFFLVRFLSARLSDRIMLLLGLVICNVACRDVIYAGMICELSPYLVLHISVPHAGTFAVLLTELVVGVFLQVLGLPFVAVSQVSLFSKVTAERTQGFSQGLRRSVGGIATILGPLWAGGLTDNLYIMLGVMMGLLSLLMVMVGLSYKYLVEVPSQHPLPRTTQEESNS